MPWTCPDCGKTFQITNQWHSCFKLSVDDHFANKSPQVKEVVDHLLDKVSNIGKWTLNPVKSAILLRSTANFLSIKTKKDHVELEFQLNREEDIFPIHKIQRLSKNRVVHSLVLDHPEDINSQVLGWIRESYDLVTKK